MESILFPPTRAFALVDTEALVQNHRILAESAQTGRKKAALIAVVKANAYGHGAGIVIPALYKAGCRHFAVATLEEAIEARGHAPDAAILILGYTPPDCAAQLAGLHLTQTVFSLSYARALAREATARGLLLDVHLKVDCGMCRLGFSPRQPDELPEAAGLTGLCPTALYTHLPLADLDPEVTRAQLSLFERCRTALAHRGLPLPAHAAASAAMLTLPDACLDAVRPGIALYGYPPVATDLALRPALSLCAPLVQVREVPCGTAVGYGASFVTTRPSRIGVLAIGYADGFPRALADLPLTLLHGGRRYGVRMAGRICMDQAMVDLTDTPAAVGDTVVLWQDAGEVAKRLSTIPYEVLTALSARLLRKRGSAPC